MTVSLVSYDGSAWLPGCLASLAEQDLEDYEVLAYDNASSDDSLALLRDRAVSDTRISITALAENVGYAAAHNMAIRRARGTYVLLLNQDVELAPGFLAAVVETLEEHPTVGSVQGRLRRLGGPGERIDILDTTGLTMRRDRRAVSRAQGRPDGPAHARPGEVWGVDGPAPVYRRQALHDARVPRSTSGWEVLDEDFFLFKEDVDLAWRMRLFGWSAWYEPAALAWHARGTGETGATSMLDIARANRRIRSQATSLSWRNQRLMQLKNEAVGDYLRDLPWIWRREVLSMAYILLLDPRRISSLRDLFRFAPAALRKRRYIRNGVHRMPPATVPGSSPPEHG